MGVVIMLITLSLLGTVAVVSMAPNFEAQATEMTYKRAEMVRAALDEYRLNNGGAGGSFPAVLTDLINDTGTSCAVDNNSGNSTYLSLQGWCGPYLDTPIVNDVNYYFRDGWGNDFSYDNSTGGFYSFGPNQVDDSGGGDDLGF